VLVLDAVLVVDVLESGASVLVKQRAVVVKHEATP
jgi:hypothetical protein